MLCLHRWQRLLGLKYARVLGSVVRKKSSRPNKIIGTCYCVVIFCVFTLLYHQHLHSELRSQGKQPTQREWLGFRNVPRFRRVVVT